MSPCAAGGDTPSRIQHSRRRRTSLRSRHGSQHPSLKNEANLRCGLESERDRNSGSFHCCAVSKSFRLREGARLSVFGQCLRCCRLSYSPLSSLVNGTAFYRHPVPDEPPSSRDHPSYERPGTTTSRSWRSHGDEIFFSLACCDSTALLFNGHPTVVIYTRDM